MECNHFHLLPKILWRDHWQERYKQRHKSVKAAGCREVFRARGDKKGVDILMTQCHNSVSF